MQKHCCRRMVDAVEHRCSEHSNRSDCPDALVEYSPKFDEYGLFVHDGGASSISIEFCPWCGASLPKSKRNQWFERLASRGFHDPLNQEIPSEFHSDTWWQGTDASGF